MKLANWRVRPKFRDGTESMPSSEMNCEWPSSIRMPPKPPPPPLTPADTVEPAVLLATAAPVALAVVETTAADVAVAVVETTADAAMVAVAPLTASLAVLSGQVPQARGQASRTTKEYSHCWQW